MYDPNYKVKDLYSYLERAKDLYGEKTLFRFNKKEEVVDVSYENFFKLVCSMAHAFKEIGIEGQKVILVGETSVQWIASYLATVIADGVIVPLDPNLLEDEIIKFSNKTKAAAIIYSKTFEKLFTERKDELETVKKFVMMDRQSFTLAPEEGYVEAEYNTFNNILALGNYMAENTDSVLNTENRDTDKLSILLFTSGTTGSSKGVMLCERNIAAVLTGINPLLSVICEDDVLLSVLPVYHTYEMSAGILAPMLYGCTICISDGIKYVGKNIKQFCPTVMTLVPLFANQLYKTIMRTVQKEGKEKTLNFGIKLSHILDKLHIDIRRKLFAQILKGLGGRIKYFVVGGAALNPEVANAFADLGIKISQGYGITECAPLISVVPLTETNPASCGKLMPGMQIFIDKAKADDTFGEIVVKGDNVMLGYYENEEETAAVLNNGWFRTGDYGYIDDKGYIYITGRKKNVIVLQGGKNVFPEELEEYLSNVKLVEEVVVVGKEDKETGTVTVIALVYPNAEECEKKGLTDKEAIEKAINDEVVAINKKLASYKHINLVEIRDEPFEKTTSRKIKRHVIQY